MAQEKKSKTDVAARLEAKKQTQYCTNCGKKVEIVLSVSSSGKKRMRRLCCESQ